MEVQYIYIGFMLFEQIDTELFWLIGKCLCVCMHAVSGRELRVPPLTSSPMFVTWCNY